MGKLIENLYPNRFHLLPAESTTPPIHLPAESNAPSQFFLACLHLRFLQLSHLNDIFLLHSAFFSMTDCRASANLFCAESKVALTFLAASSNAWERKDHFYGQANASAGFYDCSANMRSQIFVTSALLFLLHTFVYTNANKPQSPTFLRGRANARDAGFPK